MLLWCLWRARFRASRRLCSAQVSEQYLRRLRSQSRQTTKGSPHHAQSSSHPSSTRLRSENWARPPYPGRLPPSRFRPRPWKTRCRCSSSSRVFVYVWAAIVPLVAPSGRISAGLPLTPGPRRTPRRWAPSCRRQQAALGPAVQPSHCASPSCPSQTAPVRPPPAEAFGGSVRACAQDRSVNGDGRVNPLAPVAPGSRSAC